MNRTQNPSLDVIGTGLKEKSSFASIHTDAVSQLDLTLESGRPVFTAFSGQPENVTHPWVQRLLPIVVLSSVIRSIVGDHGSIFQIFP